MNSININLIELYVQLCKPDTFPPFTFASQQRTITAVQHKFSVIGLMANNQRQLDESESYDEIFKQQANETNDLFQSFNVADPLMAMLVSQMSAIHDLQQQEFMLAKRSGSTEKIQSHINATAKLSNVFIQQANLVQKLQGRNQQKVTVEHVHVHNGGQAIVGSVATGS